MFEACKSEQQTPLREETATWNPTTLYSSSYILALLPAVLKIKQLNAAFLSLLSFRLFLSHSLQGPQFAESLKSLLKDV